MVYMWIGEGADEAEQLTIVSLVKEGEIILLRANTRERPGQKISCFKSMGVGIIV
jgi:hypothetical protein